MKELSGHHVGLMLGSLFALWHVVWSLFVVLGFAKTILDWIFWLHFLNNPYSVAPFEIIRAILLVAVTFFVGYVLGWVAAWVWNMLVRRSS